jgi:hypothetical protein
LHNSDNSETPNTAAHRHAGASAISIPPALKLIALVIFLPVELSFYVFGLRLTLIRLVLFLLTPVLLVQLCQLLASGKRRFVFSDLMIALAGVWMLASPAIVFDLSYSLHHSAPLVAEFLGSYLAARVMLSKRGQALSFINLMCYVIAIVALLGVPDALAGRPVMHIFAAKLTGLPIDYSTAPRAGDYRFGMYRALGPIGHPILFGVVCALGLLLAVTSRIRAKGLTIAACGAGVLFSLSSAPIASAILGLGCLTYDRIMARFRRRWFLLIGIVAVGIGASYAFTASPMNAFSRLLFDPQTYWVRLLQWNVAGAYVLNSPWVGLGFEWGETTKKIGFLFWSIDSLWLNLAVEYGIPGAVLVALSIVTGTCYPTSGRGVHLTTEESKLATGLSISLAIVVFLGFTVHFWADSWMLVGLLVGVRAHLADLGSLHHSKLTKTDLQMESRRRTSVSRVQPVRRTLVPKFHGPHASSSRLK